MAARIRVALQAAATMVTSSAGRADIFAAQ